MDPLIWVCSELGSLKSVNYADGIVKQYVDFTEIDRTKAPCKIHWRDDNESSMLVGTKDGTVRKFNIENEKTWDSEVHKLGDSSVCGVTYYQDKIICCLENGKLVMFKDDEDILFEKSIGNHIQVMKQNKYFPNFIAAGGKENNLKVYDVNNIDKPIFAAKNVRNDMLDLRQPVWITDVAFLNGDSGANSRILTSTGDHHIKIYDPQKQKRPVIDIKWNEYPITCLSIANDENTIVVGNTAGYMASFDLRTLSQIGSFKGIAGSIRSIECHTKQDFVACCGLDRFLRLYNVSTRELIRKVYLKSQLNCILLSKFCYEEKPSPDLNSEKADNSESVKKMDDLLEDVDEESIWEKMEKTTDESSKRIKKIDKHDISAKKKRIK
eukprot:gene6108-6812_t